MDKFDKLINLIADSDNEQLQTAFLEWQEEEIERKLKLIDKLDKIASKDTQHQSKPSKLPIQYIKANALIKRFSEWNNKYPKGRIYSLNSKDCMEMIREFDELADEAQELNKHLPY